MGSFFSSLITRVFFTITMRKYSRQGWIIVSSAPRLLNVAMPDFLVEYWVASFRKGDRPVLVGDVPTGVNYWAFTVYDNTGLPVSSVNDTCIRGHYSICVGKDPLRFPPDVTDYCVVMRVYRKPCKKFDISTCLPTIYLDHTIVPQVPWDVIQKNSSAVEQQIWKAFGHRHIERPPSTKRGFFLPPPRHLASLFPNHDAAYLVAFPFSSRVLRLSWRLPSLSHSDLRFSGFMTCDLKTTRTCSSCSREEWKNTPDGAMITVWFGFTSRDALEAGMKTTDRFLQWDTECTEPIMVYREVRMKKKGIFAIPPDNNEPLQAKQIMRSFYPLLEYLA